MVRYMLSTIDNKVNPFYDYDSWFDYDNSRGYGSNEILARSLEPYLSKDMTPQEIEHVKRMVILDILKWDQTDNFCLISYDDGKTPPPG